MSPRSPNTVKDFASSTVFCSAVVHGAEALRQLKTSERDVPRGENGDCSKATEKSIASGRKLNLSIKLNHLKN
jgi:hypothetical protein